MDILIDETEGSLLSAGLQKGRLEALEVDPVEEEIRWGSVYYARVKTIDAALDAAFVDLDGENTGIIYNSDLRLTNDQGEIVKGGDIAIGKVLNPGDMLAVQAKSAYHPQHYYDGARESKIPQVSMDITLPGRYLVYCAMVERNRVSQRIRDKALRKQIRSMMDHMENTSGVIVRAAAANTQTDMLVREAQILRNMWEGISVHFEGEEPGLIMLGPDAIQRILSDHADKLIERIEVVTMDRFKDVEDWCDIFAPDLMTKIVPVELANASEDLALFYERDIVGQIESLFEAYALLPSGGNIIIQQTAALTAIDINKGGDKRSNLAINIEAAQEIARHLRLRNLGGIVIVDFLKFQSKKDEGQVIAALEEAFQNDPCTTQIHGKTALGLIEITRKRRTPPLHQRFERPPT